MPLKESTPAIRHPYTDTGRVKRCIIIIIKVVLVSEQISSTSLCATVLVCSDDVVYFQTQATLTECYAHPNPAWGTYFWTAGQRIDPSSESTFVWRTDTDSDTVSVMTYTNWDPGQPNYARQAQSCMNLMEGSSYTWNDQQCSDATCSVCELEL